MSYVFDSARLQDARLRGYMGSRIAQEYAIAEAMSLEPSEYESFKCSAPYPWVIAEEAAAYVALDTAEYEADKYWVSPAGKTRRGVAVPQATPHTPSRKWFFSRLQESRDQKTIVLNALRTVGSLEALYAICDSVQAFDENTPIWMNNGTCESLNLRPMGSLFDHVARAFDQAEARVRWL